MKPPLKILANFIFDCSFSGTEGTTDSASIRVLIRRAIGRGITSPIPTSRRRAGRHLALVIPVRWLDILLLWSWRSLGCSEGERLCGRGGPEIRGGRVCLTAKMEVKLVLILVAKFHWAQDAFERAYNEVVKILLSTCKFTLKLSLMPPLLKPDGIALYCPNEVAELLAEVFESKVWGESLLFPQFCFPKPKLCSVACRSREVTTLLLELGIYGGIVLNGILPFFFKRLLTLLLPRLLLFFFLQVG